MAISKPTGLPEWASTTVNVVEPSEGKKDDGWLVNEIPPSSYENWRAKTNWQWWQWIDEKITEGATDENLQINGSIFIPTNPLTLTNAYALSGYGKGTYPGIIGMVGDPDPDLAGQTVGVMGLAGTGSTTGGFTDIGVLGSDDAMTVNVSNVGVVGHSTTKIGTLGLANNPDITGATFSNVGVVGTDSTFTGIVGSFGVFGYSSNKAGVLGMGGAGILGAATIVDCGVVGVANGAIPTDSYQNIGVLGVGEYGGAFFGQGSADAAIYAIGGAGTLGGAAFIGTGGTASGGAGGLGGFFRGGVASAGNLCGIGLDVAGGSLAGTTGGDGGSFIGGNATSTYNAGDGIYAKGGTASGTGISGYGAELQGTTGVNGRSPLRLVPQTTPGGAGPYTKIQAGEIYYNSGTSELEYFDGANWQRIRYVGGP